MGLLPAIVGEFRPVVPAKGLTDKKCGINRGCCEQGIQQWVPIARALLSLWTRTFSSGGLARERRRSHQHGFRLCLSSLSTRAAGRKVHALATWALHRELPEAAALMIAISMAAGESPRFWFDEAVQADLCCRDRLREVRLVPASQMGRKSRGHAGAQEAL
jgi:hypothetical protein